ncbi:MAG: CehA/McbA family metallohydrolase [Pseudomonadota bacterium]|nr:CehA/McbA family metallohydrolase [Pseudomonadota bacterium]
MPHDLFCPPDGLYRGNLHGHCTHSDGRNEPAEVVRLYREAGYDFTCLSDHYWTDPRFSADTICDGSALDSEDFITLISAELHCHGKLYDQAGLWHILANGLPLDFPVATPSETGPELVERAVAAGAFVSIPHPEWYAMTTEEARSLAVAGAHAVEIYNHSSALDAGRGGGVATVDQLANAGFRTGIIATDDSHDVPADGFGGWVMVAARDLSAGSILAALKAGDYYASCGPDFTMIRLDGDQLHIACSPVSRITVPAGGHRSFAASGDGLTEARIEIGRTDFEFFRVVLTDKAGKQAWSNHFWTDDLGLR